MHQGRPTDAELIHNCHVGDIWYILNHFVDPATATKKVVALALIEERRPFVFLDFSV